MDKLLTGGKAVGSLKWTMVARTASCAPTKVVLTEIKVVLLDCTVRDRPAIPAAATMPRYLMKVARLGGYLARAYDPPRNNFVGTRLKSL
ncbi:hypothetical protein [Roseomonas sp. KE2513]|uniref:hypothetical protein n=1 Tax=Roseomonas sp. KE2513 TaxID=2479202 RepID=UPI0018DFD18D|nr:hypothetical protein [Roseomonas sp. KE2513]